MVAALSIFFVSGLTLIYLLGETYTRGRAAKAWLLAGAIAVLVVGTPASVAGLLVYVGWLRHQVQRSRHAEEHAATLANYDALTGLGNRRLLQQEFTARLARVRNEGRSLAVLMLDLDRFKSINDLYGHGVGDRLLRAMADRLRAGVREQDFIARLGGDEFAILSEGALDDSQSLRLVRRLLAEVQHPVVLDSLRLTVSTSIGVAAFPRDGDTPDLLLQHADQAMYQAKAAGRNRHAFFDQALAAAFRERLILEAELREALPSGEIVPYYQPLIDLASRQIVGFEALARWHHPTRGVLAGSVFVPLIEEAGLIADLFDVMLEKACRDAAGWPQPLIVAVNVSPLQFNDSDLVPKVLDALKKAGLAAPRLELEITETALVQNYAMAKSVIEQLKQHEIRVALDDFGTGCSSLRHLHELPLDKIKIDRSFVANRAPADGRDAVVASMISLGHSLGLDVIGEGVERRDDAIWLARFGCDQGQGYLFSEAVPAGEVPDLLAGRRHEWSSHEFA